MLTSLSHRLLSNLFFFVLLFVCKLSFCQQVKPKAKTLLTGDRQLIEKVGAIKANSFFDDTRKRISAGKANRIGNVLYSLIDDYTGESITYSKISDATDKDVDGVIVRKKGGEYFKRNFTGLVNVKWFGAIGDGKTDDTKSFQTCMDIISKNGGGVLYIPVSRSSYMLTSLKLKSQVSIIGEAPSIKLRALKSNETGLLIIAASPIQNVVYSKFSLEGNPQNLNQHGWDFTATGEFDYGHTGGIWYSRFEDITVSGFTKHAFHFGAVDDDDVYKNNDLANQFLTFTNVRAFCGKDSQSRALFAVGQFGQVQFINCEFDGSGNKNIGSTNIELVSKTGANGTDNIYSVNFSGTTVQNSDIGVKTFYADFTLSNNCHFEAVNKQVWLTGASKGTISSSSFAPPANKKEVDEFIVKNESSYLNFFDNLVWGGRIVSNNQFATNISGLKYAGNQVAPLITMGCKVQAGVQADSSLTTIGNSNILINTSSIPLKTINSQVIGNSQDLTFTVWSPDVNNSVFFLKIIDDKTGNISLAPSYRGSLILRHGEVVSFAYSDLGTKKWTLKSISGNSLNFNGYGSPDGVVSAGVGAIYQRLDGGKGTTLYVKESGTDNRGWVAK